MQLSIVLPAHDEAQRIGASLTAVRAFCERACDEWEVLVVDDGSTDGTAQVVEDAAAGEPRVRLLRSPVNRGKGDAVRRGVVAARYDLVLFSDVDLSTPIEEALALHAAIEDGADIAVACRRLDGARPVDRSASRKLMSFLFRWIVKILVLRGFHDTQCGFKMFRASAAERLFALQRIGGYAFDVELLVAARRLGLTVREVEVAWRGSGESTLRLWSPLRMVADLVRIRWFAMRGLYDAIR